MKRYFLHLTSVNFARVGNDWTTPIVDLYENNSYKNYSTTKSNYGTNLLGTGVWTGLASHGASPDFDHGKVIGGRYIDHTGEIDIISYDFPQATIVQSGVGDVEVQMDVYTAPSRNASFPSEWAVRSDVHPYDDIGLEDSFRYAVFVVHFSGAPGLVVSAAEGFVRIEIGQPNMGAMYRRTRSLLDKFPSWMGMRELGNEPVTVNPLFAAATPGLASFSSTPTSVGGQYLNAVAGEWLDELNTQLTYLDLQRFIDSVDLNQMCWAFRTSQVPHYLWSVRGDGVELARTFSLQDFLELTPTEDGFFWDENTEDLYTNKLYTTLSLNGSTYSQLSHHVWNWVDELGLLVDLRRLGLESNESFRQRILDVHRNQPGAGIENFKLALRRELNLWRLYGSTPDSAFSGATPEVLEMSDIETDPLYLSPDGMPTEKFIRLVAFLADEYPTTWGRFYFDHALWDVGGLAYEGFKTLPYRLDATPLSGGDTQSGIGDGSDLLVLRPDVFVGPHNFHAKLKARGRRKLTRSEYRQVDLSFTLFGKADRKVYNNPAKTVWLTVELVRLDSPTTTWYYSFQQTATSDVGLGHPTNTEYSASILFDENGLTRSDIIWKNKANDAVYADGSATPARPSNIMQANAISTLVLRQGLWQISGAHYINLEVSDTFVAWFSNNPATTLLYNTASNFPTMAAGATPSTAQRPVVMMQSKVVSFTVGTWTSPPVPYTIHLNGVLPDQTSKSVVVPVPDIPWDAFLESTPNKKIVVQLSTQIAANNYGGLTHNTTGTAFFLTSSYFSVNGSSSWNVQFQQSFTYESTSNLIFSVNSGALYPIVGHSWQFFEYSQTGNYAGTVDESGPWRQNRPANPGSLRFTFANAAVTRNTFGIPNTTDYIVTWMGVDSTDDPNVIVWLNSNAVHPAIDEGLSVTYPENAIVETLSGGVYVYSSFPLNARLRPDPPPQWYPQVHSGYLYDEQHEYYFYATPQTETFMHASPVLAGVARQGAPIIVKANSGIPPRDMRQTWFFDPSATPTTHSLTETQVIVGNGTNQLYLAYPDIYNVQLTNTTTGVAVAGTYSSATNLVSLPTPLVMGNTYTVTYKLNGSFYADNEANVGSKQVTKLYFDKHPSAFGATTYTVNYEGAVVTPATPVPVELSPLYTDFTKGFIFISLNEYTLDQVTVQLNPTTVTADGTDYLLIGLRALDAHGNPKPNQTFTVTTTWGTIDAPTVTTNYDGFASTRLLSRASTNTLTGVITITGIVSTTLKFGIAPVAAPTYSLLAVPAAEQIPADGKSQNLVFGKVQTPSHGLVPYAKVTWSRGRSIYDLFASPSRAVGSGLVVSDASGRFTIGPFTSATPASTGYWFVVAESDGASPTGTWDKVGDVVFWHEYPDAQFGVENVSGLPRQAYQMATPTRLAVPYANWAQYPVNYCEATPYGPATPVSTNWLPPHWYPMSRYEQYQLGLFGSTPNALAIGQFSSLHPPKQDF